MLIDIYLFLASIGILFSVLAFLRKDAAIFGWLAIIVLFPLALISGQIETQFCTYVPSAWNCHLYAYDSTPLIYFWVGIGTIVLAYTIYITVANPVEKLAEQAKRQQEW